MSHQYRRATTPTNTNNNNNNTSKNHVSFRGSNLSSSSVGGGGGATRTATAVNLEDSFDRQNNNNTTNQRSYSDPNNTTANIHQQSASSSSTDSLNKPVLVVARVRDFAPLEDPNRRSVFVTGQRTCFVQLPHQRGKVDFLVDSVIGGSGADDFDPKSGQQVYHPQIHYNDDTNHNNNNNSNSYNNNKSLASAYDYQARNTNIISSPQSSAIHGSGSQQAVFDQIGAPLIDCLLNGRNCSVVTYGETGSGKTFTTFGPPQSLGTPLEGLIPRMVQGLFEACNTAQGFFHTNISVTILEVFLEDVYDLLDPNRPKLKLRGDTNRGFVPVGETVVRVTSYDQVRVLLADAEKRRMTLDMSQNHRSSRSHVLFFLHLQRFMAKGVEFSSKLLVADLAGSERTHHKNDPAGANNHSHHLHQHEQNMKFESAISINMSLLALGSVIEAAAARDGKTAISNQVQRDTLLPEFRRSTLTKLMKDHIGGNSRTVVLVTCSPTAESANNSIQALRFGQRAMKVRTHSRINVAIRGQNNLMNQRNNTMNNTVGGNNNDNSSQQDRTLENLRARLAKRRAMVEVECTLEEELLQIRRKIQKLENDLSMSPLPKEQDQSYHHHQSSSSFYSTSSSTYGSSNNNSRNQQQMIMTSDILELRAKELQHAIAEESRIERDLFTIFDCPSGVVSNVMEKYAKRTSSNHPDYHRALDELNNIMSANDGSSSQRRDEYFTADDADIEAEECTLFAVVRKRHEMEMNDVRAQAWKTSNNNNDNHHHFASLSPRSPSNANASAANENANGNNSRRDIAVGSPLRMMENGQSTTFSSIATSPINNNNMMNNSVSFSSPSREQLEKLLSDANEEIDSLKSRLTDREEKSAELAQKLLMNDRRAMNDSDLQSAEHEEALSRNSLEMSQLRFLAELKASYVQDRTRLEYYGHLRKGLDDHERAFGGERERQLRRELEESRRETRNTKEEVDAIQIKLEISETERSQYAKESDSRWQRVTDLEHQLELLKSENDQLKHHAEVIKTHYDHQVNVQDLQRERLRNETQLSLTRMKFDGQRKMDELKQQEEHHQKSRLLSNNTTYDDDYEGDNISTNEEIISSINSGGGGAIINPSTDLFPKRREATRQPSEVSNDVASTSYQNSAGSTSIEDRIKRVERALQQRGLSRSKSEEQQQQQQQQSRQSSVPPHDDPSATAVNTSDHQLRLVRAAIDAAHRDLESRHKGNNHIDNNTTISSSGRKRGVISSPNYDDEKDLIMQERTSSLSTSAILNDSSYNNNNNNNNDDDHHHEIMKSNQDEKDQLESIRNLRQLGGNEENGDLIVSDTLSTSQINAVNRYYATILHERGKLASGSTNYQHSVNTTTSSRSPSRNMNNDLSHHNLDHRQAPIFSSSSPSETEYVLRRQNGEEVRESNNSASNGNNNQFHQQERLRLLEQQLLLERQRAEQKRQLAAPTSNNNNNSNYYSASSHQPQPRPSSSSRGNSQSSSHQTQQQQQQQQPGYLADTASSQNRHSYSMVSNDQEQQRRTSPVAPSWTSKPTASNFISNISRSVSNNSSISRPPANVAQDNLIGSPRYY